MMNMEHFYSIKELDQVRKNGVDDSILRVIAYLEGTRVQYGTKTILAIGKELKLDHAAAALISILEANRRRRSPVIANDDDQLTVGELRAAWKRRYPTLSVPTADLEIDQIVQDINDHREPEWIAGDVVKDADGKFWKRTSGNKNHAWATFESAMYHDFDSPKRPLEKVN